jgi:hypothetical protein
MPRLLAWSLLSVMSATSARAQESAPITRHASSKTKRKKKPAPVPPPSTLKPAAPGNVPPGAQLTPNRVIEAPQAPGPNTSPGRVVVPADEVKTDRDAKRDANKDVVQPPYPTGADPGRNMQPATGVNPSSQSVVP